MIDDRRNGVEKGQAILSAAREDVLRQTRGGERAGGDDTEAGIWQAIDPLTHHVYIHMSFQCFGNMS